MNEQTVKAVKVEPGMSPCIIDLGTDLDSLQKAVSIGAADQGLIEFVYLEDNISIICNEEGKLIGLAPNRRLGDDILCGVFYVVAENEDGELISLTSEQREHYSRMFERIEYIDQAEIGSTVFFRFL